MYNEGKKAFDCSGDVPAKRVLQLTAASTVAVDDGTSTNALVGFSEIPGADGGVVGALLLNISGTVELEAAEAIAVGEDVFPTTAGKIVDLPAGAGDYRRIGMAMQAATADGDVIEVLPDPSTPIVTVT